MDGSEESCERRATIRAMPHDGRALRRRTPSTTGKTGRKPGGAVTARPDSRAQRESSGFVGGGADASDVPTDIGKFGGKSRERNTVRLGRRTDHEVDGRERGEKMDS